MAIITRYGWKYEIPEEVVEIPGKCKIDFKAHIITISEKNTQKLTPKFLILLAYFYNNRNQYLTASQILNHMFGNSDKGAIDQIKGMVYDLRKKLNDTQPYTIIIEERDYGYKFILKPDGNVTIVGNGSKTNEKGTREPAPMPFDLARHFERFSKRRYERGKKVMEDLTGALDLLKQADCEEQIQEARIKIKKAVDQCAGYADIMSVLFATESSEGDSSPITWDGAADKLKPKLEQYMDYYEAMIEKELVELGTQVEALAEIKFDILAYTRDWHLTVAFLREQLKREQSDLALASSQIEKEQIQRMIRRTKTDYIYVREAAREEDMNIDDSVDLYSRTETIDRASI